MRIWCTVLRKNGTYQSVPVKAGKTEFELDGNKYNVNKYRIGKFRLLRAIYAEGLTDPLDFDVDKESKKANLKIDSKAVKNVTNKKILDVFGQEEFTKLEKLVILLIVASMGIAVINLVINIFVVNRMGLIG
jgi:hypothetical protein